MQNEVLSVFNYILNNKNLYLFSGYGIKSTMDNKDRKLETTIDNEIRQ